MWNYNFYVYITTNPDRSVLYVGVTNDLRRRLYEHFTHIEYAIGREKEIKKFRREKKDKLIDSFNPEWKFFNDEVIG